MEGQPFSSLSKSSMQKYVTEEMGMILSTIKIFLDLYNYTKFQTEEAQPLSPMHMITMLEIATLAQTKTLFSSLLKKKALLKQVLQNQREKIKGIFKHSYNDHQSTNIKKEHQLIQFVNGGDKFIITIRISNPNHYKVSIVYCIDTTAWLELL